MKADKKKLEIAMANVCMNSEDLKRAADMPRPTLNNVISGRSVRPGTIGRVAKALKCNVTEILAD
jgi:predicted transcriptional regulator